MSRKAVTAAGGPDVSRVTFHGFRHLYASSQLADGVPLPMVSALLGHGSIAVTSRVYAHWLPGQRELAASSAEALAGRLGV
jgi:integrase